MGRNIVNPRLGIEPRSSNSLDNSRFDVSIAQSKNWKMCIEREGGHIREG